jgi:archaemetzincin
MISYGRFGKDILENLASDVKIEFGVPVVLKDSYADITAYFEPSRRQYDANKLLKLIDSDSTPDAIKTIGLFQVDLFIPILTYIFGQAIYKGDTGVVSVYRLKNEQYGLPRNNELLYERFRKVVIHELGHSFGLKHCHVPTCVMRSTTYVEEIDQKEFHFCVKCREELAVIFG